MSPEDESRGYERLANLARLQGDRRTESKFRDLASKAAVEGMMATSSYSGMNGLQNIVNNELANSIAALNAAAAQNAASIVYGYGGSSPVAPSSSEDNNDLRGADDDMTKAQETRRQSVTTMGWADLKPGDVFRFKEIDHEVTRVTRDRVYISSDMNGDEFLEISGAAGKNLIYPAAAVITLAQGYSNSIAEKVSFDSVILAQKKKQQIIDTIRQVDNHDLIFRDWGFSSVFEKGTAISMLFYGPPGTGKTLMGQAIADKYHYKLQIISTADIETPEPGGAERAIQKAFREAGKETVLLFDECDSLISSRKHMGSILAAQVNALLTELEHYTGIVVFTTNRIETLDEAFDRRLSLKLEFDMPDAVHRELIWKRMFPAKAPMAKDVDFKELASVEIAGGHIKNIVLKAARMAANQELPNDKKQITQEILVECLIQEVKSKHAYAEAIERNQPLYGTPLANRGHVTVGDKVRRRGAMGVDRG